MRSFTRDQQPASQYGVFINSLFDYLVYLVIIVDLILSLSVGCPIKIKGNKYAIELV